MKPPLSAFATRKVSANFIHPDLPHPNSINENALPTSNPQEIENDRTAHSRPTKRRKSDGIARPSNQSPGLGPKPEEQGAPIGLQIASLELQNDESSAVDESILAQKVQSSTESKQEISDSDVPNTSIDTARQLCSFVPSPKNVIAETARNWTVSLSDQDSLALIGEYDLWIQKGAISILGAVLYASSKLHRVYAPSTHSLPVIKPVVNPYMPSDQRVEIEIRSFQSRIRMLQSLSSEFGRMWNEPVEQAASSLDVSGRTFALLQSSTDDALLRPVYSLSPPADWQTLVQELVTQNAAKEPSIILVCGPKGSGKSTFCQTLVNATLTRPRGDLHATPLATTEKSCVALFDIDPGQPQYVLPGQLALIELADCNLGPPFTHPFIDPSSDSRLTQLQCFGNLSPKDDPNHYLDCVQEIYDSYRSLLRFRGNLPAIINCSGWIQGGGLELLLKLIQRLNVSDVVYMSDGCGPDDVIETLASACSNQFTRLHPVKITPPRAISRTAAQLRMMQTLSYLHLAEPEAGQLRWHHKPLQEIAPLVIHYSGPKQCILAVMILGDEQNPDFLETILEGCLVDIVVIENDSALPEPEPEPADHHDSAETKSRESSSEPNNNSIPDHYCNHPSIHRTSSLIPYIPASAKPHHHTVRPLNPKHTHSLGQALIRSIDTANHQFHLLMPAPAHLMLRSSFSQESEQRQKKKKKFVLVRGRLDTPVWAYRETLQRDRARRRRRVREDEEQSGIKEGMGDEELKSFAQRTPWASLVEEGKRRAGARKRSGRRDLRYRREGKDG